MTNKKKLVLIGAAWILIFAGGHFLYNYLNQAYQPKEQRSEAVETAREAIKYVDFSLKTLDGRTIALSDYEGESAVVLNFWASWCEPCRIEMPHFQKLEEEYRGKGVVFLMVNLIDGERETEEKILAYLDEGGLKFDNILLDTEMEAAYIYGVNSIPATYVFDKDGYYVKGFRGTITEEDLRGVLEEVL